MKKFWLVYAIKNSGALPQFKTKEEAVNEAKRMQAADINNQFTVLEAILTTVKPVPSIEVEELL